MSTFRPNSSSNSPESEQVSEKNNVIEFPKPENAVGVGGTVAPPTKQEVQQELVRVILTGLLRDKDLQPVSQEFHVDRDQGTVDATTLAQAWFRVRQLGGMVFDDGPRKATFYPLDAFEKITVEVSSVIGVTLA